MNAYNAAYNGSNIIFRNFMKKLFVVLIASLLAASHCYSMNLPTYNVVLYFDQTTKKCSSATVESTDQPLYTYKRINPKEGISSRAMIAQVYDTILSKLMPISKSTDQLSFKLIIDIRDAQAPIIDIDAQAPISQPSLKTVEAVITLQDDKIAKTLRIYNPDVIDKAFNDLEQSSYSKAQWTIGALCIMAYYYFVYRYLQNTLPQPGLEWFKRVFHL
jgi:hypothetical protein